MVSVLAIRYGKVAYEINVALKPENMCGVQLGAEALSPNQKLKAVIYQFDCAATTPFTTQISILKPDEAIPYSAARVDRKSGFIAPSAECRESPYSPCLTIDVGSGINQTNDAGC
jgi:hypothetical protein